jgi:hypothetical protein
MKNFNVKSITIEYENGEKETFSNKLNDLILTKHSIYPRYVNIQDGHEYLNTDDHSVTFDWVIYNYKNMGK